ncbi:uncharacterized protein TNCV_37401 [Trichonephila clavipes]|nr:uncharacterized protein TNCV_37401 [Trichonephila clavipes]
MKIGNNGNLVLGPFDESTPCLMIVLMNCQTKLRINYLTAVKSVAILERRWIGRGGPVNWPARSPDLSCLDFFIWGHMKSFVYANPVASDEALVARIAIVADDIREMPGVFANVRQSLHRPCEPCIFAGRRFFEQFL